MVNRQCSSGDGRPEEESREGKGGTLGEGSNKGGTGTISRKIARKEGGGPKGVGEWRSWKGTHAESWGGEKRDHSVMSRHAGRTGPGTVVPGSGKGQGGHDERRVAASEEKGMRVLTF